MGQAASAKLNTGLAGTNGEPRLLLTSGSSMDSQTML